jgi:hypothetical protein
MIGSNHKVWFAHPFLYPMETSAELVQRVKSSFETKNPGLLMQVLSQASGPACQLVQEELEIQIENLKSEAIKKFDQELYKESLQSFQFLSELQPQDHTLRDYLELCEQMLGQPGTSENEEKMADAFKVFEEVNQDFKNASKGREASPLSSKEPAHADLLPLDYPVESSPAETATSPWEDVSGESKTIQNETTAPAGLLLVRPQGEKRRKRIPAWRSRFLTRCLRVSALVIVIISLGILLSLWTRHVRAPQTTDNRSDETVSEQSQDSNEQVKKQAGRQSRGEEDRRNEAGEKPDSGPSVSSDGAQDQPQQTTAYPVIHKHLLGNCRGEIRISRETVSFVPFENSGDGFKHQPSDILGIELDNTLKIRFTDRTYRFKPGAAGGRRTNRAQMKQLYQQLIELKREPQ